MSGRGKLLRAVIGFVHRVVYAALIGIVTWLMAIFPIGVVNSLLLMLILKVFDFPVAVAGLLLPWEYTGIDLFFGHGFGVGAPAPEEILLRHLRVAIPVYVLLFYVPNLIKGGIGLIRRRQKTTKPDVSRAAGLAKSVVR